MRRSAPGAGWRRGAIASAALHAAFALAALRLGAPPAPPAAAHPAAVDLELGPPVHVPVPVPVPELERPEPAAPAPSRPHARHPARRPDRIAAIAPSSTTPATAPEPPSAPDAAGGDRECAPGEGGFLVPIDPRSVAARALAEADPGPGATSRASVDRGEPGDRRAGRQADLEQSLRDGVRGPDLSERPPPPIRPAPDGGYDVEGIRLRAHVAPDGRITFQDGPPIEDFGPGFIPGDRERGMSGSAGVSFRFDLNDGVFEAAGEDPLRTERQFLLRHTEPLRDRLAARARRVDEERAILALGEELRAIAADRALSPARRREEIFALWDDCATDAIGERARTLVEDFVRARFPAGTALAYTEAELLRLNRRRATGRPFDPYRSAPDAGPADGGA